MKKSDWQYLVDTLLFVCIVGIVIIGFLMGLFIPKGPTAPESSKYFLGVHRHQWGNIHFYLSIAFTALVIVHLIFSWKWIKAKATQLFKKRWGTVLTLTTIASFSVLFFFWIFLPKYSEKFEQHGTGRGRDYVTPVAQNLDKASSHLTVKRESEETSEEENKLTTGRGEDIQSEILITGQMTLYDIEKATGVSAREIANRLGLPQSVPLTDRLGRLRRYYNFTMQQVRDFIEAIIKKKKG